MNIYLFIFACLSITFLIALFQKRLKELPIVNAQVLIMSFLFATAIPMIVLMANNYLNTTFQIELPYMQMMLSHEQPMIPRNGGQTLIYTSYGSTSLILIYKKIKELIC